MEEVGRQVAVEVAMLPPLAHLTATLTLYYAENTFVRPIYVCTVHGPTIISLLSYEHKRFTRI